MLSSALNVPSPLQMEQTWVPVPSQLPHSSSGLHFFPDADCAAAALGRRDTAAAKAKRMSFLRVGEDTAGVGGVVNMQTGIKNAGVATWRSFISVLVWWSRNGRAVEQ